MENKRTLIEELKLTEAGSKFVEKIKPLEEEKSRRMTKREAIGRIVDHMIVHQKKEPRAIFITEALEMAIKSLEFGKPIIEKADYLLNGFEVKLYKCPRCKTKWKERFKFCPECGLDWRESEVEE